MERPALLSLTIAETEALLTELGCSPTHARPIRRSLLLGDELRGPRRVLDALAERVAWLSSEPLEAHEASDGSAKLVVGLSDGRRVEAVHLPGKPGGNGSACISSQVGCAMACRFCASGLDGVDRNLAVHELLEQVVHIRRRGEVRRLVFMGSGEPTQNHRNLAAALEILRDEAEIGPKHILVSTVGPPNAVERLASLDLRFTLALSLHAIDPALRAELIPTQKHVDPIALLDAADRFAARHRRPYQVEYVLLGGVNDSLGHGLELAEALAGRRAHVSLIAWNAVPGMAFVPPREEDARAFVDVLRDAKVSTNLRRTVGGEAVAACGQLVGSTRRRTSPGESTQR